MIGRSGMMATLSFKNANKTYLNRHLGNLSISRLELNNTIRPLDLDVVVANKI